MDLNSFLLTLFTQLIIEAIRVLEPKKKIVFNIKEKGEEIN